jgi:hypothetical protein
MHRMHGKGCWIAPASPADRLLFAAFSSSRSRTIAHQEVKRQENGSYPKEVCNSASMLKVLRPAEKRGRTRPARPSDGFGAGNRAELTLRTTHRGSRRSILQVITGQN